MARKLAIGLALLAVASFVMALHFDVYHAVWLRSKVGLGEPPVVTAALRPAQGGAEQIQTLGRIEEPPQYWAFYYSDGQLASELEYQAGGLFAFIPTKPGDWVEVYSNVPFSDFSVWWEEWGSLADGKLRVEFWRKQKWDEFERSFTMGRVPAGPPEERGYSIVWGCYEWSADDRKEIPGYGALGYALRFRVNGELPQQAVHTTIRSCMPEWETHPDYAVAWVEHVDACDNLGGFGWSGKMLQVWVENAWMRPVQGAEVRFGTEQSFGIAYDRPDIGGLSSRFGLVEWDSYGVATRYWMCVEDFCIRNIRTDLANEYCIRDGRITSYRPPNRPGWHSWKMEIIVRKD